MRNNGPETESSALRFGGIALTDAQASIALVTALPTVMTILVRRDTKE